MQNFISEMLNFYGLNEVPSTFSDFMFWLVSLCAAVVLSVHIIWIPFSFLRRLFERR